MSDIKFPDDFVWGVALGALAAGAVMWAMGVRTPPEQPALPAAAAAARSAATAAPTAPRPPAPSTEDSAAEGGDAGPGGAADLVDALAAARARMADRAWIRPQGDNVRLLLRKAADRWPDDPQVAALHREAAERALADAIALKYAGKAAMAAERVRLALSWAPDLPGAQPLLDDIEAKPDAGPPADGYDLAPQPTRSPDVALPGASTQSPPAPAPGRGFAP